MGEIIRTWMRTRLGVIIDLSPEIFGHYARDGTLLGKLLHSYDIINDSQLSTLNRTQDPALARVNLKNLRIWLRFIGVDCDDDYIEDISNGKGTTALRLFYKVFLCLENKDTLHFITLQKEREKFIPNSSKFDVTTVLEEPEPWAPDDDPLVAPLKKNANLIDWHRKKYRELIDGSKKEKEKFRESQEQNKIRASPTIGKTIPLRSVKSSIEVAQKKELDEFAKKHRIKQEEILDPCRETRRSTLNKSPKEDPEAAKAFAKSLKNKHRQEAMTKSFKSRMQKNLLSHLWEQVLSDQEMELDEIVARKVLDQSQYEKQLMHKLCDIRREKSRMAGNRQIIEELSHSTRASEARLEQERTKEILVRESEEVEAESRRIKELERKINEELMRKKRLKIRKIGEDVFNDLVEMAIKASEYIVESNDENVPKSLWSEWKTLFIKNQPITDLNFIKEPEIYIGAEQEEEIDEEINEQVDSSRTEVLKDEDFENYHKLRPPWNDFLPEVNMKDHEYLNLGLVVLGYIVHKILMSLHRHTSPIEAPIPKMKIRTVVVGVPDPMLYDPIQELLMHSRIHLVRMEEAINHCLKQYKSEMQDVEYIDLKIIAATKDAVNKTSRSSSEYRNKQQKRGNKSVSSKEKNGSIQQIDKSSGLDKLTQTPRVIPYEDMDPCLTDTAYIGKWTHEFLTLGTPLSDELNARIIVEYLKSLKEVDGFVLVNYPNTYLQMKSLEFALSGKNLPDDSKYSIEREEMNIEEIDPISSRISFENEDYDSRNEWIRSRLVPNPIEPIEASDRSSYLTAFIRMKPKPESLKLEENERYEILPEVAMSLDAFYVEQEIASIFYYKIFDLATLKKFVRLVITGEDESLGRASSTELFGEAMETFSGRREDYTSDSKAPVVKKLLSKANDFKSDSLIESDPSEWTERSDETKEEIIARSNRSKSGSPCPGEADWVWANLPQPSQLIEGLAVLWRNLETSYIDNLKDIFCLKRTNFEAIVPYASFVAKHMNEYIERPDRKQDLLHEFHRSFNNMDEDIREHDEVKHELHCRVADFQTQLWEVCNNRRQEAEDERRRIILDHWASKELVILANVYIGIIQAEIDRFTGTLQIIQDYYLSMLQRSLQDIQPSKIILQKIPFETSNSSFIEEISSTEKSSSKSIKDKNIKEAKAKFSGVKITSPPIASDENIFKEEMVQLLTEVDQETFDPVNSIAYKTIETNIRYVQIIVESITSSILDILKKEETNSAKSPVDFKDKKGSSRKVSESSRVEQENTRNRARNLILEWRYAVMFEINRIHLRMKILEASARTDVNYLVDKMRHVFVGIHQRIIERFNKEIKSVNDMASTFCFAIEEAIPIQEEMLLDGDRFLVRSNVLMFPSKSEIPLPPTGEDKFPAKFQMSQIGRLMETFHRVAPTGNLPERAFVYILQDLISYGNEEHETSPLPSTWLNLHFCDVPKLVNDIFGDVQFVDWREFIIYAMAIEPPTVDQLLDNLEAFRKIDKESTDVIGYEEFHSVDLWFFDEKTNLSSSSFALHKNSEDNEEMHRKINDFEIGKQKMIEQKNNKEDEKPKESFRFTLAKELLCEMFLSKNRTVNYVALLLAFCKDNDPKNGLGKALSLATGNKICMDWQEGERYVNERLAKSRQASEARAYRSSLRDEAIKNSESIVKAIVKSVLRESTSKSIKSLDDISLSKDDYQEVERAPIHIEKLDVPGEIVNPADLLPPEPTSISPLSDEIEETQTIEETKSVRPSVTIILPDESENTQRISDDEFRKIVYWLSIDVCQSVLSATLPKHAIQPDLLETGKSLCSNLEKIFHELRIEELYNEAGVVLAHRFLEHSFIKKLLTTTSIFSTKNLDIIVDKIS